MQRIVLPEYPVRPHFGRESYARYEELSAQLAALRTTPFGDPYFRFVRGDEEVEWWAGYVTMKYPFTRVLVETKQVLLCETTANGTCPRHAHSKDCDYLTLNSDERKWTPLQRERYAHRVPRVKCEFVEAGAPFWVLERWLAPELACAGWDDTRWYFQPGYATANDDGMVDLKGPAPARGAYMSMYFLRDERGYPREPSLDDIEKAAKALAAIDNDEASRTYRDDEATPEAVHADRVRAVYDDINAHDEAELAAARARIKDRLAVRLIGTPARSFAKDTTNE